MSVSSNGLDIDLLGGPFAVIESDPGVFTTLMRKLGLRGLEIAELYDIEPWAVDHLQPRALIFCYPCADDDIKLQDSHSEDSCLPDPDAERIWFAHQLCNDACASQALLNIVLNLSRIRVGAELERFKRDTEKMDPVMRGLAMTNCQFIRQAHNSLARPADLRGSSHAVATSTLEYAKSQKKTRRNSDSSPPKKRRKQNFGRVKKPQLASAEEDVENYHFIAYVPIDGKVWELDGLRLSGPLEVGEITSDSEDGSGRTDWMSVVRPALRRRMQSLQSNESDHVRYNLLAVVEDRYEKASDALEMLKRKRNRLESRLNEELPEVWTSQVDPSLLASRIEAFATSSQGSSSLGPTYDPEFGSRKLEMEMDILDMPARKLGEAWETCVRNAMTAKVAVEDELSNSIRTQTEQLSRTFDYEPLFQTFITCLHNEGCLGTVLPGK